jgi:secretion/DNA translocation related CpaE-like protein
MSSAGGLLSLVDDIGLRADVDRVAAAVGMRVVHAAEPSNQKVWTSASAVVVDGQFAARWVEFSLPRRARVYLIGRGEPTPDRWQAAIGVGAQRVLMLPEQEDQLVAELSDVADGHRAERRGAVIAVIGGRGGAGASVFATALALAARDALLVDVDPWGGGIDLVLGSESESGLRWPDLTSAGGRLSHTALRDALPVRHGVAVLSAGRGAGDIDARAVAAVLDAGCRGGATVVCDLPRRDSAAAETVLAVADLVTLVTCADVRSCAASAALGAWLVTANPNVGLVVRGPSPGGLRAADVARITGLPLLAAMRPQHQVAVTLEHGGLVLRRRSPLAVAARRVHAVLGGQSLTDGVAVGAA